MQDREIIWIVVNTNSVKEADRIGMAVLKKRLCACFGIIPRVKSVYYWPPASTRRLRRGEPKSSKLEISRGPLLTLETLPRHYSAITKLVKSLHSDKVPFIAQWEMENVEKSFYKWLTNELTKN